MAKYLVAFLPAVLVLGACSEVSPYDRSKWEKAEKPINKTTNQKMVSDMNAAPKVDPNNPYAKPEAPDDWGAATPRD